jgi:hypothetical protein
LNAGTAGLLANMSFVGGHEPAFGDGLRARIERALLGRDPAPVESDETVRESQGVQVPAPADLADNRDEPGEPAD